MRVLVCSSLAVVFALACGGGAPTEGRIGTEKFGISRMATDGTSVWTAGPKGFITEWNASGQVGYPMALTGQPDVTALAADGGELYVGAYSLTHWDSGDLKWKGGVTSAAVRGPLVLQTLDTEFVVLYEDDVPKWEGKTTKWVYGSAFSPDGSEVAAWTWDGELYRWSTPEGTVLQSEQLNSLNAAGSLGGPVFSGAWIDETHLVLGGGNARGSGFAAVWDTGSNAYAGRLVLPTRVHAVATGRDGLLALACDDGQVWVWDRTAERAWPVKSTAASLTAEAQTTDFPIGVPYASVAGRGSIVGMVPYYGGVVVGAASGDVVFLDVFAPAALEAASAGEEGIDEGLPPPPDPLAFLSEPSTEWREYSVSAGTVSFSLRVPGAIPKGVSDRGFLAHTDDYGTRVVVHERRGTTLEKTLAAAASLRSSKPWLDEKRSDGHVIGDGSGVARFVVHEGGVVECLAMHRGDMESPEVRKRLLEVCDTLSVR